MTLITEELKANSEVFYSDELRQEKSKLLEEVRLPHSLLPLKDIIECGYVEQTGFVWLKQKKKIQHCFEKIGKQVVNRDSEPFLLFQVTYDTEITAYVEKLKIKKLTGVKAKELLVWLNVGEAYVHDLTKLVFKSPTGLSRAFPCSASYQLYAYSATFSSSATADKADFSHRDKLIKNGVYTK